jgi:HEPN domain-containing protein
LCQGVAATTTPLYILNTMEEMSKDKIVMFWMEGSKESLRLANEILKRKYYGHALFCGHLALEKYLKARIVDVTDNHPPHSHDLPYLAGMARIDLDPEQQQFLAKVNGFNIEGRYPEDKMEFYQSVKPEYSIEWLKKINDFYLWLSSKQKEKN